MNQSPQSPGPARPLLRRTLFRIARASLVLLLTIAAAWIAGALHVLWHLPLWIALLLVPALLSAWFFRPAHRRITLRATAGAVLLLLAVLLLFFKPSNDRDWVEESRIAATAVIDRPADRVLISNLRTFRWRSPTDHTPRWEDRTLRLSDALSLDLIIEPLANSEYAAHSMLSFGFRNGGHVIISVEARREKGETYGVVSGLYRQFELIYQITDEEDALTLRAHRPDSHLYIYPLDATPEFIRNLFVGMLEEANAYRANPGFYHTLSTNCTSELFDEINKVMPHPISYRKEVLFPGLAGQLLVDMHWLAWDLPFEEARQRARSADRVRSAAGHPGFSQLLRTGNPPSPKS